MEKKSWILSKDNTAPFILVSVTYCIFLILPFIYFLYLKGKPHTSYSVELNYYETTSQSKSEPKDTTEKRTIKDTEGVGIVQLNEFDDPEGGGATEEVTTKNMSDWEEDADSRGFILLTRLAIFSVILSFGALGAAISLITRTRNNESILNNISILEILSVQTIGAVFSLILGFAFMGNMLGGTLFPNPMVFYRILYIPSAFAKLIVWSFIAGFSERLVPNILNNFVKKADNKNEQNLSNH